MDEKVESLTTGEKASEVVNEEKKEIRYKKIDCESGYLTDEVEIENFKIYQRRDIVENFMLGDYNDKGDYVLGSKILKGMVGVRKEKTGDYNQVIFLSSVDSFGEKGKLKFSITINSAKDQEGYKIAVLKLLEPVKKIGGYIENTNSFIVASYKDVGDEQFVGKVLKIFHVVDSAVDGGKDDPEIVASIIERLKYLSVYKSVYDEGIFLQEQAYYYARLEILKDPRFEGILNEYKKHLTKASMFIDPSAKDYYAKLNELLDLSIDIVGNRDKQITALLNEVIRPITEKHNQICLERDAQNKQTTIAKIAEESKSADVVAPVLSGGQSKGGQSRGGKSGGKPGGRPSGGKPSGGKPSGGQGKDGKSGADKGAGKKPGGGTLYKFVGGAKQTAEDKAINNKEQTDDGRNSNNGQGEGEIGVNPEKLENNAADKKELGTGFANLDRDLTY